jgi:hypothetical protein
MTPQGRLIPEPVGFDHSNVVAGSPLVKDLEVAGDRKPVMSVSAPIFFGEEISLCTFPGEYAETPE